MAKRKVPKRNQTGSPGKVAVTVRLDVDLVRTLDRMADLRDSSRSQMLQQAVEFYTWMARGGAAVQMFEPWKDPDLVTEPEQVEQPEKVETPSDAEQSPEVGLLHLRGGEV